MKFRLVMYKRVDYLRFHTGNTDDDESSSSSTSCTSDESESDTSGNHRGDTVPAHAVSRQPRRGESRVSAGEQKGTSEHKVLGRGKLGAVAANHANGEREKDRPMAQKDKTAVRKTAKGSEVRRLGPKSAKRKEGGGKVKVKKRSKRCVR